MHDDRLWEHLHRLIDDIGLDELFTQMDLDPAEVLEFLINSGRAELPPGLALEDGDDTESEA